MRSFALARAVALAAAILTAGAPLEAQEPGDVGVVILPITASLSGLFDGGGLARKHEEAGAGDARTAAFQLDRGLVLVSAVSTDPGWLHDLVGNESVQGLLVGAGTDAATGPYHRAIDVPFSGGHSRIMYRGVFEVEVL